MSGGTRDSLKQKLHHSSKVECLADTLESLFRTMRRCGVNPMEVTEEVTRRERERTINVLASQTTTPEKLAEHFRMREESLKKPLMSKVKGK